MNAYAEILKANIAKLLSLYDVNPISSTYGYGDRLYWGWKLSDYANGTFQGGVHALAVAYKLNLIPERDFLFKLIDSAILAIEKIRDKNGSLVESYPQEHSFCVTALVAFDILSCIKYLKEDLPEEKKRKYFSVLRPLIGFITKHGEEHAIISNHLATGVAAITLWNRLTGEDNQRWKQLIGVIYKNQSKEGWYREYEGADPGYQTLCTYYLASALEDTGDAHLKESLLRSIEFLQYFVHPDGTIGGLYGSRNTEVYYPGGIVALASHSDIFKNIALKSEEAIKNGLQIQPDSIDANNFIPLINSYAYAAQCSSEKSISRICSLPFQESFEKDFNEAGIFIKSTEKYYCVVNYKKGGTLKIFDKQTGKLDIEDGGIFGVLKTGKVFSTQMMNSQSDFSDRIIEVAFYEINNSQPSAFSTILLRFLSLTIFRSVALGNFFKKFIVRMLMTDKKKIDGSAIRQFQFSEDKVAVKEKVVKPSGCVEVRHYGFAKAIHMASSGYYNEHKKVEPEKSKFVTVSSE